MDEQADIIAVDEHYEAKMMMVAREKSWQAVRDIGAAIRASAHDRGDSLPRPESRHGADDIERRAACKGHWVVAQQ